MNINWQEVDWLPPQEPAREYQEAAVAEAVALSRPGPPFPLWARTHESPPHPVLVGFDRDRGPLYVGRAFHKGNLLPAKVAPRHQGAFVGWAGREYSKFLLQFEVLHLLRGQPEWVEASDGDIPARAFPVGQLQDGRLIYCARVSHDGTTTPGRLVENDTVCYIPYDGKEIAFTDYQVLIVT